MTVLDMEGAAWYLATSQALENTSREERGQGDVWKPPQALMFSLFGNVYARIGIKRNWGQGMAQRRNEVGMVGLSLLHLLSQPFASIIPLEVLG